jgi:hypothetical protein
MFNPFSAAVSAAGFAFNAGSKVIQIVGKRSNKAKLVLDPNREINPILIHCFIADTNSSVVHPDGRGYKIPYLVNRVAIKNNGKISAEFCEGYIVKDNRKDRVSWSIPSERVRTSIHPESTKELEVGAILYLNPIEFNRVNQTLFDTKQFQVVARQLGIPSIISPAQSGIQSPPTLNRLIQPGRYLIEVNYTDPDPLRVPIIINPQMDERGIFITLTGT